MSICWRPLTEAKRLSLLKVVAIQRRISEVLGRPRSTLGELECVKPRLKPYIESDLINVF